MTVPIKIKWAAFQEARGDTGEKKSRYKVSPGVWDEPCQVHTRKSTSTRMGGRRGARECQEEPSDPNHDPRLRAARRGGKVGRTTWKRPGIHRKAQTTYPAHQQPLARPTRRPGEVTSFPDSNPWPGL